MVRRTKEEAQQTRNALLDAAEGVFERRGVAGASLQEVADAAGVTRGAVYWHFRDKADLFNAMMDRAVLPFEQHWLAPDADDAADPIGRLRALLLSVLREIGSDTRLQRAVAISTHKIEYVGELESIRERHLHRCEQGRARVEALLRLAAASGQLAPGVTPKAAARALHALVDGLIEHWMLEDRGFDLLRAGRGALQLLLAGICAPGPA